MTKLAKIAGSIVIGIIAVLLILRFTGFEPKNCPPSNKSVSCRMPGLWLKGKLVTRPVTDWSFTNKIQQIKIQTQTPYLLPHSVTIWCVVYKGDLYLSSYPGREWVEDIIRDPHVRLKIGNQLFDRGVSIVRDPAEKAAVLQAKGEKYPQWKVPSVSRSIVFRVTAE